MDISTTEHAYVPETRSERTRARPPAPGASPSGRKPCKRAEMPEKKPWPPPGRRGGGFCIGGRGAGAIEEVQAAPVKLARGGIGQSEGSGGEQRASRQGSRAVEMETMQ